VVIRAKLFLGNVVTGSPMGPSSRIYLGHRALVRSSPNSSILRGSPLIWAARWLILLAPPASLSCSPSPSLSLSLSLSLSRSLCLLLLSPSAFVKSTCGELGCFTGQSRDPPTFLGQMERDANDTCLSLSSLALFLSPATLSPPPSPPPPPPPPRSLSLSVSLFSLVSHVHAYATTLHARLRRRSRKFASR